MSSKSPQFGPRRGRQSCEQVRRAKQAELGMLAQSIGERELADMRRKIKRGEPLNLSVDEIVRLITEGVELERRALE